VDLEKNGNYYVKDNERGEIFVEGYSPPYRTAEALMD